MVVVVVVVTVVVAVVCSSAVASGFQFRCCFRVLTIINPSHFTIPTWSFNHVAVFVKTLVS